MSLIFLKLLSFVLIIKFSYCKILECDVSDKFTVNINSEIQFIFNNSSFQITLDLDTVTHETVPNKKIVYIKAPKATIKFKSKISDKSSGNYQPYELNFINRICGFAKRAELNKSVTSIYDCRVILIPDQHSELLSSGKILNTVQRFAESCIEDLICTEFNTLESWKFTETLENSMCLLSQANNDSIDKNSFSIQSFQAIINKIVDNMIVEVISTLKKNDEEMIDIPNIQEDFTFGKSFFKTTLKFLASEGKFGNLSTLRRTRDVILTRSKNEYKAFCAFELGIVKLNYQHFTLQKLNGNIDCTIDGVELGINISLDYSEPTKCFVKIEKIEVTKFGQPVIRITGFGPANSLVSKLLSWVTNKWKDAIMSKLKNKILPIAQEKLSAVDCEKLRPA